MREGDEAGEGDVVGEVDVAGDGDVVSEGDVASAGDVAGNAGEESAAADVDPSALQVRPAPTPEEAAAIAAAVGAHLADEVRLAGTRGAESARGWTDRRWRLAARLSGVGRSDRRVPDGVPTDAWTASGRADRF